MLQQLLVTTWLCLGDIILQDTFITFINVHKLKHSWIFVHISVHLWWPKFADMDILFNLWTQQRNKLSCSLKSFLCTLHSIAAFSWISFQMGCPKWCSLWSVEVNVNFYQRSSSWQNVKSINHHVRERQGGEDWSLLPGLGFILSGSLTSIIK